MELNWRNKPPTERQIAYIMQMQEDAGINGAIPLPRFTGKTRGETSDYIDANKGKRFKSFDYAGHGDNYGDRV